MAVLILSPKREYKVTVVDGAGHPWEGRGFPRKFAVAGQVGATLVLQEGLTYHFNLAAVPQIHPFYFTTSIIGAERHGALTRPRTESITADLDTMPNEFFYQCSNHESMGGRVVIVKRDAQFLARVGSKHGGVLARDPGTGRFLAISCGGGNGDGDGDGEPILASDTCYRGDPVEAQRKLQSGVIRGVVNEGTPGARNVVIDLRGASGTFEEESEEEEEEELEADTTSVGQPRRRGRRRGRRGRRRGRRGWGRRGRGRGWWWTPPWWWWWWLWSAPASDVRVEDGDDAVAFQAEVRVGLLEIDSEEEGDGHQQGQSRFSVGLIEIVVDGSSVPLRVTSAFIERRDDPVARSFLTLEEAARALGGNTAATAVSQQVAF